MIIFHISLFTAPCWPLALGGRWEFYALAFRHSFLFFAWIGFLASNWFHSRVHVFIFWQPSFPRESRLDGRLLEHTWYCCIFNLLLLFASAHYFPRIFSDLLMSIGKKLFVMEDTLDVFNGIYRCIWLHRHSVDSWKTSYVSPITNVFFPTICAMSLNKYSEFRF